MNRAANNLDSNFHRGDVLIRFAQSNIGLALLLVGMILIGGCSTFDRDWNAAAGTKPVSSTDINGRWQGTWASDADGHSGALRCLITQKDPNTYHGRYEATYGSVFHFGYEMDLTGSQVYDWVTFQGSADLGTMAGGEYRYDGRANADYFYANYRSGSDNGQFNMKRPSAE